MNGGAKVTARYRPNRKPTQYERLDLTGSYFSTMKERKPLSASRLLVSLPRM